MNHKARTTLRNYSYDRVWAMDAISVLQMEKVRPGEAKEFAQDRMIWAGASVHLPVVGRNVMNFSFLGSPLTADTKRRDCSSENYNPNLTSENI